MLAFVLGWEVFLGITGPPGGVAPLPWPMWLAAVGWIGWYEDLESRVLRIRCGLCSRRGGGTVLHVSLLPVCLPGAVYRVYIAGKVGVGGVWMRPSLFRVGVVLALEVHRDPSSALASESPLTAEKSMSRPGRRLCFGKAKPQRRNLPLSIADF